MGAWQLEDWQSRPELPRPLRAAPPAVHQQVAPVGVAREAAQRDSNVQQHDDIGQQHGRGVWERGGRGGEERVVQCQSSAMRAL